MTGPQLAVVAVYLRLNAATMALAGLVLLLAPASATSGPAMTTVLDLCPSRHLLGVAMLGVAVALWVCSLRYPHGGLLLLLAAQTFWTLGLTVPLLVEGRGNALSSAGWLGLAGTTLMILFMRRGR